MWYYNNRTIKTIKDLPNYEHLEGFVYLITNLQTGKFYVGKKSLYHNRKTKISKREIKSTGTRKRTRIVTKESDWQTYYGSSEELRKDLQIYGVESFKRTILEVCCGKKYLSFCELKYQVQFDVLKKNSYNGNILGRYYSRDMENCI